MNTSGTGRGWTFWTLLLTVLDFLLGPWEEKNDVLRRLSYNRLSSTALMGSVCYLLIHLAHSSTLPNVWTAVIVLCAILQMPVVEAVKRTNPLEVTRGFFDMMTGIFQGTDSGSRSSVAERGASREVAPPWTAEGGARV